MPSFMYPRTIQITRTVISHSNTDGLHQAEEVIMSDVAASIQLKRSRPVGPPITPGTSQSADSIPEWLILFKGTVGVVHKGDKITDDTNVAYQIEGCYWNSLGYNVMARLFHP